MSISEINRADSSFRPNGYYLTRLSPIFRDWSNCKHLWTTGNTPTEPKVKSVRQSPRVPVDKHTIRLSNATRFYPDDVEGPQLRLFRRLLTHHKDQDNDRVDTDTRKRVGEQYKHHLIFCLGTKMGLKNSQLCRARNLYMRLDLQRLGILLELIALCVLLRVMKADERDDEKQWSRSYHPNQGEANRDSQTAKVVRAMKSNFTQITDKRITKTYHRLGCNPPLRSVDEWEPYVRHDDMDTLYKP